jgi:hypothetical protein
MSPTIFLPAVTRKCKPAAVFFRDGGGHFGGGYRKFRPYRRSLLLNSLLRLVCRILLRRHLSTVTPFFCANWATSRLMVQLSDRAKRAAPVEFNASYKLIAPVYHRSGHVGHWLTERYCLYGAIKTRQVVYEIHHPQWADPTGRGCSAGKNDDQAYRASAARFDRKIVSADP